MSILGFIASVVRSVIASLIIAVLVVVLFLGNRVVVGWFMFFDPTFLGIFVPILGIVWFANLVASMVIGNPDKTEQ